VRYVADFIVTVQSAVNFISDYSETGQGAVKYVTDCIVTVQFAIRYVADCCVTGQVAVKCVAGCRIIGHGAGKEGDTYETSKPTISPQRCSSLKFTIFLHSPPCLCYKQFDTIFYLCTVE